MPVNGPAVGDRPWLWGPSVLMLSAVDGLPWTKYGSRAWSGRTIHGSHTWFGGTNCGGSFSGSVTEHVECLRRPDKIDERLYAALMASPSKALLYCCTTCRRKGCIVKQLYKMQSDLAVVHEQRVASARK